MIPRARMGRALLVPGVMVAVCAVPVHAQWLERPTVIRHARIVGMDGPPIEDGTLVIKGGVIRAIGREVKSPLLARTFDARGRTVTPGLIDADGALGLIAGRTRDTDATAHAIDAFDRYATSAFRDALRNGVTSLFVPARGPAGITGVGAVVRLARGIGGSMGEDIEREAALCIDLGSGHSATARLKTFRDVRKRFREALEYRQAREDYEEDLKEYEKALKERAGKKKKEAGDSKEKPGKPTGEPKPQGGDHPAGAVMGATGHEALAVGRESGAEIPMEPSTSPPTATGTDDKNGGAPGGKGDASEKKKDELKKPVEPAPDRRKDMLLRAIDREMPVRVRADRSADIVNALRLADEFSLDLVLVGAAEGYLVADAIADAHARVVLGRVDVPERERTGALRRADPRGAAVLSAAGVAWALGSGATDGAATRFILMNAQAAAAWMDDEHALRRVTVDAADVLGLSSRVGRLRRGMRADVVVWNGDPLDPTSTVHRVYVDGKLVYQEAPR